MNLNGFKYFERRNLKIVVPSVAQDTPSNINHMGHFCDDWRGRWNYVSDVTFELLNLSSLLDTMTSSFNFDIMKLVTTRKS
jgi:hypothetical protein